MTMNLVPHFGVKTEGLQPGHERHGSVGALQDRRYRLLVAALRERRLADGITQSALAMRLGRRQQFVSKYESLERRVDVVELMDIAHALELDLAGLLLILGATTTEQQPS